MINTVAHINNCNLYYSPHLVMAVQTHGTLEVRQIETEYQRRSRELQACSPLMYYT